LGLGEVRFTGVDNYFGFDFRVRVGVRVSSSGITRCFSFNGGSYFTGADVLGSFADFIYSF